MVMTKELDENVLSDLMFEYLNQRPVSIEVINITLIINVQHLIDIDEIIYYREITRKA